MSRVVVAPPRYTYSLVVGYGLTVIADTVWWSWLWNYDGEMGVTPSPSIWSMAVTSAVGDAVFVSLAFLAWLLPREKTQLWLVLMVAYAARGCLFAISEVLSLELWGSAPFTVGHFYRGAALSMAGSLVLGIMVAGVAAMIGQRRRSGAVEIPDLFD
jgi:hypothetical protein